jgi:hypothetical protein
MERISSRSSPTHPVWNQPTTDNFCNELHGQEFVGRKPVKYVPFELNFKGKLLDDCK